TSAPCAADAPTMTHVPSTACARARCGSPAAAAHVPAAARMHGPLRRARAPSRRAASAGGPWPLSDPPAHQHFRRSRMSRSVIVGFLLTLSSAFFFAVSGPIAKTMYAIGWTPGSVVLIRLAGSAVLLLIPTLIALRGRWDEVLRHWRTVVTYGLVSMAGVQGFYFVAVEHLTVA